MLEIISALIPFFLLGIAAAGLSRVSGVALSMIIVPTLLIWGANAIDVCCYLWCTTTLQWRHKTFD